MVSQAQREAEIVDLRRKLKGRSSRQATQSQAAINEDHTMEADDEGGERISANTIHKAIQELLAAQRATSNPASISNIVKQTAAELLPNMQAQPSTSSPRARRNRASKPGSVRAQRDLKQSAFDGLDKEDESDWRVMFSLLVLLFAYCLFPRNFFEDAFVVVRVSTPSVALTRSMFRSIKLLQTVMQNKSVLVLRVQQCSGSILAMAGARLDGIAQ